MSRGPPGSSPHTRGAHSRYAADECDSGIIPAYAGSTWPWPLGAHWTRIIPAYAGSTRYHWRRRGRCRDHPRIRGEHQDGPEIIVVEDGSSPHTRGAQTRLQERPDRRRIIPAYAGSTQVSTRPLAPAWDHPRIRGEHPVPTPSAAGEGGSSPHTRGARLDPAPQGKRARIIPAYAGSTNARAPLTSLTRDHPRIRGEHRGAGYRPMETAGSSPHTRGAQQPRHEKELIPRIIPAYAGSTP